MIRLIIILCTLMFIISCTASYNIMVRQDGSATAVVDRNPISYNEPQSNYSSDVDKHYKSKIISNIDTTLHGRITFDISTIDSLGYYLTLHPSGLLKFKMENGSLTISEADTIPPNSSECYCCHMLMEINFDRNISKIKSTYLGAKKKNSRTVKISKPRRHFINGKKKFHLTIKT